MLLFLERDISFYSSHCSKLYHLSINSQLKKKKKIEVKSYHFPRMALHLSANKSQGGGRVLSAPRYKLPTLTSLLVLPSPAPWSWHGFLSAPQKNLGSCTPLDICTRCSLVWNILPTDTRMAHSYHLQVFPKVKSHHFKRLTLKTMGNFNPIPPSHSPSP